MMRSDRASIRFLPHGLAIRAGLLAVMLGWALLAGIDAVRAQVIDIDGPEIKKGEWEVKSLGTINGRYKQNGEGSPRSSHEIGAGYSPLDWLKISAHLDFENVIGEDFRLEHGAVKTFVELLEAGDKGGLGIAWHTALQGAIDQDATNSIVFGPILKLSGERTAVALNPYFERTFGRNRDPGMAFVYGLQARYDIRQGLGIGIESIGKIEDIGDAPPWSEQDHRIGPALFLEWPIGGRRALVMDISALAGLTDAAPTASLKVNVGAKF